METFNCDQCSKEWFTLRIGSIGGSSIAAVCAKGKNNKPSKTRKSLLYRLAGEILSNEKYEGYSNSHMARGVDQEPEAKRMYSFITDLNVLDIGLVRRDEHKHCSPDGMVNHDGIVEVKCVIPSVQVETIDRGKVPPEYVKQVQWNLFITGREWCDFISYSPTVSDKPIWIIRAGRNEELMEEMDTEADKFIEELKALVEKIKSK